MAAEGRRSRGARVCFALGENWGRCRERMAEYSMRSPALSPRPHGQRLRNAGKQRDKFRQGEVLALSKLQSMGSGIRFARPRRQKERSSPLGQERGTQTPLKQRRFAELLRTYQPGNNTVSITWMTPFDCMTFRMVT